MTTASFSRQRGVALVITLIVLVIVSILSVSSIRTTTLQERMSGNILDREITFQSAESVLRLAEAAVANNPSFQAHSGVDCSSTAAVCQPDPLQVPDANWRSLAVNPQGGGANQIGNNQFLVGTPQYLVQYMGASPEQDPDDLGQNLSANVRQYGGDLANGAPVSDVFRITVRNVDPDQGTDRSFVMLQSTIRVRR